jgi:parallel beta-helix repeat protein
MSRLVRRWLGKVVDRPRAARAVRRASDHRIRLLLQALEGRVAPANFTVSNADDAGAGSLRQAILDANAHAGADTITFNSFFSTPRTITLTTGQLSITGDVTITGRGAARLTVSGGNASRVFNISDASATTPGVLNVTLSGMTITGGTVPDGYGGGVFIDNENVTILDSVITGNTVGATTSTGGGGIGVYAGGSLTVRNTTISGNTASGWGGGIYFRTDGSLLLENSTISGNTAAQYYGGGIYFYGKVTAGGFTIRNSTISGNTAVSGGGLMLYFDGDALIENSTITLNAATSTSATAGDAGGGIDKSSGGGTITLVSSIVSGNTTASASPARADLSVGGVPRLVTATNSAIGVDPAADTVLSPASANNLPFGATLDLQPLASNGGPTQTHALGPNSLATNKGANPAGLATDQRGTARALGGAPDIGAFESALMTPTATSAPANVTAAATTYSFTVTYAAAAGIDVSTLGNGDVRVTGPGGFSQAATFVSVNTNTNGTPREATYTITPPGGSWDPSDFGAYTVAVEPNQVADANGAFEPAIAVGGFQALVPMTFTVGNAGDAGAGSLRQAILDANARPGPDVITFDPAFFNVARTITLTSDELLVSDSVTIDGTGVGLLTVRRDPAAATQFRIFDVNGPGIIDVTISGMTITGGSTAGNAAGVNGYGVTGDGGGLLMFNDDVTLNNVVVSGNTSGSEGGAVGVAPFGDFGGGGFLTIRNSTISGNTSNGTPPAASAGGAGGGVYFAAGGSLLLENSTISGNTSTNSTGGGVYFYGPVGAGGVTIRNSTISGNTAATSGGGLYLGTLSGTVQVQNSTIAGNTANGTAPGQGGGGIGVFALRSGAVVITSSVIANNTNANAPDLLGQATVGFSLIRNQTGSTITDGGKNLAAGTDPLFAAAGLADNGGPTQTIALQATSPLINAGSNPAGLATDQRGTGFARVSGPAADIGAFEVQAAVAPRVTGTQINGGADQRSMVTTLTVTFSTVVSFANNNAGAAFTLTRNGGGAVQFTATVNVGGGVTTVTLDHFTGAETTTGSLNDGGYTLTALASQITAGGQQLDGNGDGTPGDNYVLADNGQAGGLFRLFGDSDGNRVVDALDLLRLRTSFGKTSSDPGYLAYFDYDGSGSVDALDLLHFRLNFGRILP